MASTPSASALSAVLRCRGNIWARNPPSKRPPSLSLGLGGAALRDSPPPERTEEASAWEAFLSGERAVAVVVVGRGLSVSYNRDSRKRNTTCHPRLSQPPGDARSAVPCFQNALVRQLARVLTPKLPGIDSYPETSRVIRCQTHAGNTCEPECDQETGAPPAGAVSVCVKSVRLGERAAPAPSLLLSGWSALKNTCSSLTHLVSEFVFVKLVVLCRSSRSPDDAPQHLDERHTSTDQVQAHGRINKDKCGSGPRITEDRPD